jgi:ABC-type multidrug transport system fused ATPase/permease subunit
MMSRGGRVGGGRFGRAITEDKKDTRSLSTLVQELMKYLRGFLGLLILALVISIIYAAVQLINPLILSRGIRAIDSGEINFEDGVYYILVNTPFYGNIFLQLRTIILLFGGMYLGLGALAFVLQSFSTRILSKVRAKMLNEIRMDVYHQLINSSMSYLKKEQSGNVTARITGDTEEIGTGIQVVINVAIQFMLLIATLILLVSIAGWQITVITLGTIPVAIGLSLTFSKIGRRIILRIRKAFGLVSAKMAESISGIAVSKSFNREENQNQQMNELNQRHYRMNKQFGLMVNIAFPLIGMIASIASGAILWVSGAINMGADQIFLGVTLANQFLQPLIILSFSFPQLQSALGAMDRVLDVLEATPAIKDKSDAESLVKKDLTVTFDKVYFAYQNENWVIKDFSFTAKDGQLVALVGHTGAGKTTIASMLLPRFYDIQKGSIKIGGQDIRSVTQHSLRQTIGLIPQEPYLFTATILENIRYGKPNATEDEILSICKLIGADEFIDALPNGYDTMVKEGGKQLSAGQRQIITIARTMLADPEILVLDEATSRLDTYSESLVQAAQEKLFKNRTTFVIAHRLSTIHNAEKIIVLDHGKLVEEGTHQELMRLDGIYADLYKTYYAFQGLEKIDLEAIVDDKEEVELSPLAMLERGMLSEEKISQLMASGKITPQMMSQMKQQLAQKQKNHQTTEK